MAGNRRPRLLVLVVAYNAEKTIQPTLERIPASLVDDYEVEILVIDDSSTDSTFEHGEALRRADTLPFVLTVLFNPVGQGYGGNQKIGFHYAVKHAFEFVALVHGDGRYAPECLPALLMPLASGEADAVLGSRMLVKGDARRGGMPLNAGSPSVSTIRRSSATSARRQKPAWRIAGRPPSVAIQPRTLAVSRSHMPMVTR